MKRFLCIIVCFTASCSTVPERDQLDLPPNTTQDPKAMVVQGHASPEAIDAQQIFDWQKFYRSQPGIQDQATLKSQLEAVSGPVPPDVQLKQARNSLAIGQKEKARDLYLRLVQNDPKNIDAQLELAHLYLAEKDSERAFDYLGSIRRILDRQEQASREHTVRYRFALATAYIQTQNRKKGHQILTDLIAQDPRFIPAYAALAQSYLQQGQTDLAAFIAKRGLDRGPDEPRLLNLLAVTHLRQGQQQDAREWIQKALTQNPDFVPALINRAHLAILRREYAAAENDLQKAINLDPLNLDGQLALGLLFRRTGRLTAARNALEKAVQLDPQNPFARYHLGILLAEDFKDRNTALQLFYDVLQARDDESELKNLAKIQIQSIRDSRLYER